MTEQVLGPDKCNNGTCKKSIHAYRSAWMARWARMGSDAALQGHGCLSFKDDDLGCSKDLSSVIRPKMALGDSVSVERFRDVSECRRVDNVEEKIEEKHWKKPGNVRRDFLPFPMFNVSQQRDGVAASRNEGLWSYPERETSSRKRSLILGGDNDITGEMQTKSCEFLQKNALAISSSSHDLIGSSSKALVNKRPRIQPWMYTKKENALLTDDSDQGTRRAAPYRFSQTARHFLFTKKTNVNLPEDVEVLRESPDSMKLKGKMISGFSNLFPDLLLCHQERVRPQPLGTSKDGLEIVDEVKNSAVHMKSLAGSTTCLSTKVEGRENQSALPRIGVPDMNQEPPVVLDRESHGGETSSLKTQSMDVEHFLSNAQLHTQCYRTEPEPEPEPEPESEPESSRRWLERLKTNASDSSGHRMNMKVEDSLCGEKVNDFFLEIMKSRITDPETRNQQPSKSETKNPNPQGEEVMLQHPWVQRWCRNKATSHRPEEPQGSCKAAEIPKGTTSEETSEKQFPSIGAMALMGKGLRGFSSSGLKKNDSITVWNTWDLR